MSHARADLPEFRAGSEGVDGLFGWIASEGAAAEFAVVAEPVVDVGELGLGGGSSLVEVLGSGEAPVDVLTLGSGFVDCGREVGDLGRKRIDGAVGPLDLALVAAAAQWPVISAEDVEGALQLTGRFSQVMLGNVDVSTGPLVLAGKELQILVKLIQCPRELFLLSE